MMHDAPSTTPAPSVSCRPWSRVPNLTAPRLWSHRHRPGVTSLPNWNEAGFPKWPQKPLSRVFPHLGPQPLDLLGRMLTYDPNRRVSAKAAAKHAWFSAAPAKKAARPNKRRRTLLMRLS